MADRSVAAPAEWESHEGMVTVYRADGSYAGCMGVERWGRLLREDEEARAVPAGNPAADERPPEALVNLVDVVQTLVSSVATLNDTVRILEGRVTRLAALASARGGD